MSKNIVVGGWSALKSEIQHAVELFGRSAGPDGAVERIKFGVSQVIGKFESLAAQEPEDAPVEVAPDEVASVEVASVEVASEGSFDHTNPDAQ